MPAAAGGPWSASVSATGWPSQVLLRGPRISAARAAETGAGTDTARWEVPIGSSAVASGCATSSGRLIGLIILHDQRRHHAEQAVVALGVAEDVAVEGPDAGLGGVDQHVDPLAGGDQHGVLVVRVGQVPAVLGDD